MKTEKQNLETGKTDVVTNFIATSEQYKGVETDSSNESETTNNSLFSLLREELKIEREHYLRLAAEYENYRRRTQLERTEAAESGKRTLLLELITIADDLDLALLSLDEQPDQVAEGLKLMQRRFRELLRSNGVIPFESRGKRFNPELHEAFDVVTATVENKPETVKTEVRRGYFWNDKLLRPALVVVAK